MVADLVQDKPSSSQSSENTNRITDTELQF